ncbi:hypothetical protein CEP54_015761 [Fusarium duplospermum]|uniref:Uncharacterized protein n=1 Tax=Fusarium duplospermum TaxID=1325734 RepID=A0A428NLH0_9HYPO|nr:hypothetical protein CEP54_015761 [Fusarium duplospermum]
MSDEPTPVDTTNVLGFTLKRRLVETMEASLESARTSQNPQRIAAAEMLLEFVRTAPSPTPDQLSQWLEVQKVVYKEVPRQWLDANKWIYSDQ